MPRRQIALGLPLALGLVLLLPSAAWGAACCMSATARGVGRLLIWEDAALGMVTSLGVRVGQWDLDGGWQAYGDDYAEQEWRTDLWTLIRASRRASFFLRAPLVVTHRRAGDMDELGGGLGDLSAGLRYELLEVGEVMQLPAIAVAAGVTVPSGRDTSQARQTLGTDVTGRGAWALAFGVSVEKTRMPWFVRGDIGVIVPMPAERGDLGVMQRYGPGVELAFIAGWEPVRQLVVSGLLWFNYEASLHLDGELIDGSKRFDTGVGAGLSWRLHPHWTAQLAVDTHLYVSHLGSNGTGQVTTSLGVRYGFF